jgi:tetratricopeptide (TPR) repeat protein
MRTALLAAFLLMVAGTAMAWDAADNENFSKANKAYRESKFDEAARLYGELAEKYPRAAVFQYNLGNALHRLGKQGPSILAYERALFSEPRNPDIRKNLEYVRGLLEYRIEDKRNWYLKAAEEFLDRVTEKEVLILVLGTYALLMAGWAFVLFFRTGAPWGWRRKLLLVFSAVFFMVGVAKNLQTHVIRDAIVVSSEAKARYGPSEQDKVAFRLGEGLKIHVLDRREDWSRIFLVNGEGGWVRNDQIAEVRV